MEFVHVMFNCFSLKSPITLSFIVYFISNMRADFSVENVNPQSANKVLNKGQSQYISE